MLLGKIEVERVYKGKAQNKIETIKHYKFCICYENTQNIKGYITEKIFDCFAAGVVPIYWGASNIEAYIPKTCFIDQREFQEFEEVYQFILLTRWKPWHSCRGGNLAPLFLALIPFVFVLQYPLLCWSLNLGNRVQS